MTRKIVLDSMDLQCEFVGWFGLVLVVASANSTKVLVEFFS